MKPAPTKDEKTWDLENMEWRELYTVTCDSETDFGKHCPYSIVVTSKKNLPWVILCKECIKKQNKFIMGNYE